MGDTRDTGSVPELERSPGEGSGNHSSMLAWKIPWTEEADGIQSTGSQRVGHNTWALSTCGTNLSSVAQLCPTLGDPTDCSTPGAPVHHQLLELAQTHIHLVGDAILPSHPLSSPSPPCLQSFPASGLSQRVNSLHQVAKVLELQSFQWIFKTDFLEEWLVWSSCSPKDSSRVFSNISNIQQFKRINSSVLSFLYGPTCTIHDYWKSHSFDYGLAIAFEQSLLLSLLCHLVIETALYPHVPNMKGREMSTTVLNATGIWTLSSPLSPQPPAPSPLSPSFPIYYINWTMTSLPVHLWS